MTLSPDSGDIVVPGLFLLIKCSQWRGYGGYGGNLPPHCCQDGALDFLKIDEKIGVGRWY